MFWLSFFVYIFVLAFLELYSNVRVKNIPSCFSVLNEQIAEIYSETYLALAVFSLISLASLGSLALDKAEQQSITLILNFLLEFFIVERFFLGGKLCMR